MAGMPMRSTLLVTAGVAALVTAVAYVGSLDCDFAFDDHLAVAANSDVLGGRFDSIQDVLEWPGWRNDFWGRSLTNEASHKSWRPLTTLTFRLDHVVGELSARQYHGTNLALHALVSTAVGWLAWALSGGGGGGGGGSSGQAVVAAALFAAHPVHVEAVTGVVGRAELLCALFFLLAYAAYRRAAAAASTPSETGGGGGLLARVLSLLACCLLYWASMLSKETGVVFVGVAAVHEAAALALPALLLATTGSASCSRRRVIPPASAWFWALARGLVLVACAVGYLSLRVPPTSSKGPPPKHLSTNSHIFSHPQNA